MSGSSPTARAPPGSAAGHLDLDAAAASGALVVSAETREDPVDQQHRHEQEAADARLRRWKDGARFAVSGLVLVALTGVALCFALRSTATPEEKAWARGALLSIATGVGGYFIGRGSKD